MPRAGRKKGLYYFNGKADVSEFILVFRAKGYSRFSDYCSRKAGVKKR
jgi:hypothetical protein